MTNSKEINWGKAQPASLTMWQMVQACFPLCKNLGIYNRRNVAGTNKPSAHAEGRALDIGLNVKSTKEKEIGDFLFYLFIEMQEELGLDHVIWNRQIWGKNEKIVKKYEGKDPHTNHVHVAWTRIGSQKTGFPRTYQKLIEKNLNLKHRLKDPTFSLCLIHNH